MMIHKSEEELREIVDDWAEAYFKGEIYGFGLSDEMDFPTFFEDDLGNIEIVSNVTKNLHDLGFKADTHRKGSRVGRGFRVKAVFDNNPGIQNTICRGHEILSPAKIPEMGKIKIAIFPRRYFVIKEQLERFGMEEYKDFVYYNFFVAFYHYYVRNKVLLWKVTVGLTAKCTLRCEACNMFMPYYKVAEDVPYEELSDDLDILFSRVDSVQWFGILGGEPLLYKRLPEYLQKMKAYSNRMGESIIDTNGSVVPGNDVLMRAKELENVRFMINNYELGEGYAKSFHETVETVRESGISYTLRNYDWNRYRREHEINDGVELKCHYIRCNQPFIAFQNKRLYTCHLPWSASRCGISLYDPQDSVDFSDPDLSDLDIVKAGLGHIPRGHTSNCSMCNGCDPQYFEKIPKAVQINKRKK